MQDEFLKWITSTFGQGNVSFTLRMGCTASIDSDPNVLYGGHKQVNNNNKFSSLPNGPTSPLHPHKMGQDNSIHPGTVNTDLGIKDTNKPLENGATKSAEESKGIHNAQKRTYMKGDLSMYSDAKVQRDRKLRARLMKRELMAQEMSERIMDEHERLSLTSSRSRATSRATSPRHSRHNILKPLTLPSSPCSEGGSSTHHNVPSTSQNNNFSHSVANAPHDKENTTPQGSVSDNKEN